MTDYVMISSMDESFDDFKKKENQIIEVPESSCSMSNDEAENDHSKAVSIPKKNIMFIGAEKVGKGNIIEVLCSKQLPV